MTPRVKMGSLSRACVHIALLVLSYYTFTTGHQAAEALEFVPFFCFVTGGAITLGVCFLLSNFVFKDDKLGDGVTRDVVLIWISDLWTVAPILSVSLLPDLPVNATSFAEIGIQIDKGMVVHEHLQKIHKQLWNESNREEWLPWQIPQLTSFRPTVRISIPRTQLDHSTRQLTKTSRGKTNVEYDLLVAKFWLPESSEQDKDTIDVELDELETAARDDAADGEAATEKVEKESADSKSEADGEAAKGTDANATDRKDAAKEDVEELDLRSYVNLVVRASPRLELFPHPKRKNKKAQARIMEQEVTICGRFFNGIPRGEARDDEAVKLDIDLPKDPNSLAFSFRAEDCGWEPIFFSHRGTGVYWLFVPIWLVARKLVGLFATEVIGEKQSDSMVDELWSLFSYVKHFFKSIASQPAVKTLFKKKD